jgi:hypothetical protein
MVFNARYRCRPGCGHVVSRKNKRLSSGGPYRRGGAAQSPVALSPRLPGSQPSAAMSVTCAVHGRDDSFCLSADRAQSTDRTQASNSNQETALIKTRPACVCGHKPARDGDSYIYEARGLRGIPHPFLIIKISCTPLPDPCANVLDIFHPRATPRQVLSLP